MSFLHFENLNLDVKIAIISFSKCKFGYKMSFLHLENVNLDVKMSFLHFEM